MSGIQDESWIAEKKADVDKIIAACLGLHVEASTATEAFTPGQTAAIKLEAINRSNIPVTLQEVRFLNTGDSNKIDAGLPSNELVTKDLSCRIPDDAPYSQPYWLRKPGTLGTFAVDDQKLIGLPENPPALPVEIVLQVNGQELRYLVDTKYRTRRPGGRRTATSGGDFASGVRERCEQRVRIPDERAKTCFGARYRGQWSCERRT